MSSTPSRCSASSASETDETYPSISAEMLNSNTVYSTSRRQEYAKTIGAMEVEVSRLDNEMSRLQQPMDHLANVRQKLQRSLDEHRSIAAPIRRIPQEILSEIFLCCLVKSINSFNVRIAPLLLTLVCSRWRTVAIFTPRLWSSISLDGVSGTIEMLQTWLSRSGMSPLKLVVDSGNDRITYPRIDTLVSHSHRWQDVEFILELAEYTQLAAAKGHLPMLERLYLDTYEDLLVPMDIFEVAPRLHVVEIDMEPTQFLLPWQQLRRLHARFTLTECLHALQQCTNIVHCSMECSDDGTRPHDASAPWLRTQLQTLRLVLDDQNMLRYIFGSLTSPALLDLEIDLGTDPYYRIISLPGNHLLSFLDRSSCKLQRLCLHEIVLASDELIMCLHGLFFLVELEVEELSEPGTIPMVNAQTLKRMTLDVSGRCLFGSLLVPRLRRLTLSARFDFDDQVILDMVQSRRGLASLDGNSSVDEGSHRVESLELVVLSITRELHPETIYQMAFWKQGGLGVRVKSLDKSVV